MKRFNAAIDTDVPRPSRPCSTPIVPTATARPRRPWHKRHPTIPKLLALTLALAAFATGCVERTIHITSEPPGALVWLNDEEVGRTPLAVPFTFYGTYDVRLERDGYQPLWTTAKTDDHWWELPGPDLVAEAIPNAQSNTRWHFTLNPDPGADEDDLIERAKAMRQTVREQEAPTEVPPMDNDEPTDAQADEPALPGDEPAFPGDEPAPPGCPA